ncbi:hypothetical protein GMOD_00005567 [Pyrenophora seminiperda CCB06]|uniref:Uncharacterized protein n=1 Tax=Pyrenophora seminiperda CCB06 TaxID=1302712 RepID=A0A3M7M9L2_9PLEO|nr:hypothetical protein GMOD_00005567 [Pyrenophora seminiperda CCB06]
MQDAKLGATVLASSYHLTAPFHASACLTFESHAFRRLALPLYAQRSFVRVISSFQPQHLHHCCITSQSFGILSAAFLLTMMPLTLVWAAVVFCPLPSSLVAVLHAIHSFRVEYPTPTTTTVKLYNRNTTVGIATWSHDLPFSLFPYFGGVRVYVYEHE